MDVLTSENIVELIFDRGRALDEAQKDLALSLREEADAERKYRLGRARAWITAPDVSVRQKEDWVNGETADLRFDRDLAQGKSKAAMELVRNVRQQLSAIQSASNSVREEAAYARVGPADTFFDQHTETNLEAIKER